MDKDGYCWAYEADDGTMIGQCRYKFIRFKGNYLFKGTFYYNHPDFFGAPFASEDFDSLSDCAMWVQKFTMGGYYCELCEVSGI